MKRAGVLVGLAAAVACSPIDNHLLEGQQYEPAGACLTPPSVIDDLSGPDPGDNCSPTCITASSDDGGLLVFVTTTCPPYPSYYSSEVRDASMGASDPCKGAFAAYADGAVCGPDGGAPPDAGAEGGRDAEAGVESGSDAGTGADATVEAAVEAGADAAGDAGQGE